MAHRSTLIVVLVALALGVVASRAPAATTTTPLAPVADDTPISAYGGWVVWSEKGADGLWHLVSWHAGVKQVVPGVGPRAVPFDVDIGPEETGNPVVVFSRCATEPDATLPLPWSAARGCTLRADNLANADSERPLSVHPPKGASDSTPSVWGTHLAFQRHTSGSPVAQLMLHDFGTHHTATLRHGAVSHACPYRSGCAKAAIGGEVDELDLGPRAVAFSWRVQAPAVEGVGVGWEMRVERLHDQVSVRAGKGYMSGACGGESPSSPNVRAAHVLFLDRRAHCDGLDDVVTDTEVGSGLLWRGTSPGVVLWRVARDAKTGALYGVAGPGHQEPGDPVPGNALTLVQLHGMTLQPTGRRAGSPFLT
jgi:hypothetical protein